MIEIKHGDCLEIMRGMEDNSIDFIVTDSPYGISFMSKGWGGSGSTLCAAKELGISCIGIEKEDEYVNIAKARVESAKCIPEQIKMAI